MVSRTPPVPVPIIGNIPCNCGYNLRGLTTAGVCPECGTAIQDTLNRDGLRELGVHTLERMRRGVFIAQVGTIMQVVAGGVGFGIAVASADHSGLGSEAIGIGGGAMLVAGIVSAYGWWLLCEDRVPIGKRMRQVLRVTLVLKTPVPPLAFVAWGAPHAVESIVRSSPVAEALGVVAGLVGVIAWFAWFFGAMNYMKWLGSLSPDRGLEQRARRMVRWQGPLLLTVGWLVCLGPLIAVLLYLLVLEAAGRELRGAYVRAVMR